MESHELSAVLERHGLQGPGLREQRRYEIARDVMAGIASAPWAGDMGPDAVAVSAVRAADALLAALEAK